MRRIVFAVLLSCCLTVTLVSQTIRVCADAELWFEYTPSIHVPTVDNDGDGYYESASLCIGVRSSSLRGFEVGVYGRDLKGIQHFFYNTSAVATEWSEVDMVYKYIGHTKLTVPSRSIWDFRLQLYDLDGVVHDTVNYGDEPTLTDVKMEGELVALAVRGEDNRIYYRIYDATSPGTWGDWHVVPTGTTIDSPAACLAHGTLQIVVRGMDGQSLWHCSISLTDYSFSGWDRVNGATNSKPTLYSVYTDLDQRETTLFVRGLDNRVYYSPYDGETFGSSWNVIPSGTTCDSPGVAFFNVVVRGMDGNSLWYASRTFTGWQLLDGATNSAPTLTDRMLPGSITKIPPYVYQPIYENWAVRGLDNSIYTRFGTKFGYWLDWSNPFGTTCDSPAVAIIARGAPGSPLIPEYLFVVRGMDGHSLWWHGYGSSGWDLLSGSTPSAPTLAR